MYIVHVLPFALTCVEIVQVQMEPQQACDNTELFISIPTMYSIWSCSCKQRSPLLSCC